jgi:hypothetical protein
LRLLLNVFEEHYLYFIYLSFTVTFKQLAVDDPWRSRCSFKPYGSIWVGLGYLIRAFPS